MAEKAPHEVRDEASGRAGYAKSADTRVRILTAAPEEASDSGFHKTSLARIAVRAGAGAAVGNPNYKDWDRD
jgi:AcrR family transcriptional regulator